MDRSSWPTTKIPSASTEHVKRYEETVSRRNARTKEEGPVEHRRDDAVDDSGGCIEESSEAGWRPVGRSVGVADSNGRRSVSRLLRGSYVNMETGSWNPVLDSTYDSNQRG